MGIKSFRLNPLLNDLYPFPTSTKYRLNKYPIIMQISFLDKE